MILERPSVDAGALLDQWRADGVTWGEVIEALTADGYDARPLVAYISGQDAARLGGWWTDLKNTVGKGTRDVVRDVVPGGNILVTVTDGAKKILSGILSGAKTGGQDAAEGWLANLVSKLPFGTKARVAIASVPPWVYFAGIGLFVWMVIRRRR